MRFCKSNLDSRGLSRARAWSRVTELFSMGIWGIQADLPSGFRNGKGFERNKTGCILQQSGGLFSHKPWPSASWWALYFSAPFLGFSSCTDIFRSYSTFQGDRALWLGHSKTSSSSTHSQVWRKPHTITWNIRK